ncbi:helix-turn-helix domain-containing protein [Acinetobacter sp. ANC 3813]|uniref:helix-turn-helix domain-containing protein n=1 Tax=Acinetobacter sp. ANC 3813 TaxID=1977873 RepID=UPI000A3574CA|nr:helix-turn-helix transcriptional regulator [Acinetobacter sp. ANC 3813]OTG91812.1 transcriptional regulator [Acinetobacter sp. ANC 3813]
MVRNNSNVFSMRLKIARKAKKLSQERLGILAGIDEASASARMNQYETGKYAPDLLMVKKIAEVLEVPVAYFYTENNLMAEIIMQLQFLTEVQHKEVLDYIHQTTQKHQ